MENKKSIYKLVIKFLLIIILGLALGLMYLSFQMKNDTSKHSELIEAQILRISELSTAK